MSATASRSWRWRFSFVCALLGGLVGLAFAWQAVSQAGAQPFEPRVLAAFKDKQLLVSVGLPAQKNVSGKISVSLLDVGRQIEHNVGKLRKFDASIVLAYAFDNVNKADADKLRLRIAFQNQQFEVPLTKALLGKGHETLVSAGAEFHADSTATIACTVQGVRSLAETVPHAGADVTITLINQKLGKHPLFAGTTDKDGKVLANVAIPALTPGVYTMQIASTTPLGKEALQRQVRIKADGKILLVSDRPIYQPGHQIHLRALALNAFDMKPLENKELIFEIEDPKGNKVFKRAFKTSAYGIASVDFQLADEVNMGDYHVRAVIGTVRAEKTVQVKRYVLPKFKVEVKADKNFYLPKETVKAEVQSDYFFGKPVANSQVEVTASTFDVAFKEFSKWKGTTDANGHAKFEIKLPDYFVGTPLHAGNAIVKLDVKVHDNADHTEKVVKSYPVSDLPIRVNVIAEGGKLVPEMANRIFVAATYPDGSPAPNTEIQLWHSKQADAQQSVGRAPTAATAAEDCGEGNQARRRQDERRRTCGNHDQASEDAFRIGGWGNNNFEMMGGNQQIFGAQPAYDLRLAAKDPRGNQVEIAMAINSQPLGENVLLRLDKAIYQTGERVKIDVRTSAGLPTVYVDIVRGGQIMLSKWLEVKDGAATQSLDLPPAIFGSLEIHAYQMLSHGEIIRDSRVVYVQPNNDLKIAVTPGKTVYEPGEDGRIRFQVTDQAGKPVSAALGVIIVDEAVYALQDLQPGLEKVYFTLQEELLKPSAQIKFSPGESVDGIVRLPVVPAGKQQIAEVLFTGIKLPMPQRWEVNPGLERQRGVQMRVAIIAQNTFNFAWQKSNAIEFDKTAQRWVFRKGVLADILKTGYMHPPQLDNGFGGQLTLDDVAKLDKTFTAENLGHAITTQRLQQWNWQIQNYADRNVKTLKKDGRWTLPADALELARTGIDKRWLVDGFGETFRLVKKDRTDKKESTSVFDDYDIVSTGPSRKVGGKDNVYMAQTVIANGMLGGLNMFTPMTPQQFFTPFQGQMMGGQGRGGMGMMGGGMMGGGMMGMDGGFGGGGPPAPRAAADRIQFAARGNSLDRALPAKSEAATDPGKPAQGGAAPITRVREFFPETMLWQPALITDERGIADMAVNFADSITTWRLSASANSKGGAIGGATVPLKVFQDFFVDIDLPVHLTQSDEVSFPVSVFNYLKTPQTVKIELQKEPWFELLGSEGYTRALNVGANEVTSVSFRIRAAKIGWQPLTVKAFGSKKSDAVKRSVEVVPNGQKIERVVSDRLTGNISQTLEIPANALPDASKLMVRMFPGAMAQVVDGLDGMMRMPCGCFEQTSSSAYPNVLIVDYIKKNRVAAPAMLMKAEQYLNVGYQRLLTFERPGGGFDWWGREAPLIWTSAYGLQQFNDMAKVYPIDRGIIERTQAFLMRKRDKDATWSNIGATHGETIASMGNPKLLLTSYVTWSLLESGYDRNQLRASIDYIRNNLGDAGENGYILALAANALAAYDPKDDSTLKVCQQLDKLRVDEPQLKVQFFPARGTSLNYGRGDSVSVETTALAALAMIKTGQFNASVNQSLAYLVKSKQASGTWGTTQATILALKALLSGMGGAELKNDIHFTIKVNGVEAQRGKIGKADADVMQAFDLTGFKAAGANQVEIEVNGETNLMYQIVSRHFEPWKNVEPEQPAIDVKVEYDRTKLSTKDMLKAKATLKYNGKLPTYMVMLDLGIAPGFTVDAGDFAEMVSKNKIKKFEITARQVILYLGDVRPGDELTFEYVLRPRYPLRARTPATTAYEYNTPGVRSVANPVELVVEDKK